MKWECKCIWNTDLSQPWIIRTCELKGDDSTPHPERCPFMVRETHWEVKE